MCFEISTKQLNNICEKKSQNWDHRLYFKIHNSNGMCVKILFELLAEISPIHKKVYSDIKNTIWSHYILMINGIGLIKEFEKHGMKQIKEPKPGAFLFIKKGNLIGHVGLCVDSNKFWHLNKKGFICEDIDSRNIACFGVF